MNIALKEDRSDAERLPRKAVPDLPHNDVRWTVSRKLQVLNAVQSGRVTLEEVLERYKMSEVEFQTWKTNHHKCGTLGLMVKMIR